MNQQVFVKHGSFYIHVQPSRLQLVTSSSQFSTEPVSEQSLQYNHNHQNKNITQNQQAEIYNSSDLESGCSDTNKTPPQNEHNIHIDMTSHQPNHQETYSTTTSKRKSVKITPKIQVRYMKS